MLKSAAGGGAGGGWSSEWDFGSSAFHWGHGEEL